MRTLFKTMAHAAEKSDKSLPADEVVEDFQGYGFGEAGFFSGITWGWVSRLISFGSTIEERHLDQPSEMDRAEYLEHALTGAWHVEVERAQAANKLLDPAKENLVRPSLWRALWGAFGYRFMMAGLYMLPYTAALIAQPLMLRQLVTFVSDPTQEVGWGFLWASIMVLASTIQFHLHHWYFWLTMQMGMQIRSSLGGMIYRKALSLPIASLATTTTGQIVNLISNDAEKFDELGKFMHYLWAAPLQSIIVFILIYREMGVSCIVGFAVMLLTIPLQTAMSKQFTAIRKHTVGFTDQRVKTVNEILIGAMVMKLYAWEEALQKSVAKLREKEFDSISGAASLKSVNLVISTVAAPLVYLATFGSYLAINRDNASGLTASSVFTTISLFGACRVALTNFLPYAIEKVSECVISVQRIEAFMTLGELERNSKAEAEAEAKNAEQKKSDLKPGAIVIRHADFAWSNQVKSNTNAAANESAPLLNSKSSSSSSSSLSSSSASPVNLSIQIDTNSTDEQKDGNASSPSASSPSSPATHLSSSAAPTSYGAMPMSPTAASTTAEVKSPQNASSSSSSSSSNSNASPKSSSEAASAVSSSESPSSSIILHDVNLRIAPGSLVAVVGPIGSGKSSLLAAILGEMNCVPSSSLPSSASSSSSSSSFGVQRSGQSAIATQKSWILGDSVRSNILFHRPLDAARYERVLRCCQLVPDINSFHAADNTVIGERGVSLSGGQRARVSLARAVYDDQTDIFLLDDPLAAVDAVVGARLFKYVIGNGRQALLRGKTRVLVTHHTHFLPRVDHIIVMHQGRVAFSGSYAQLQSSGLDLEKMVPTPESEKKDLEKQQQQALAHRRKKHSKSIGSEDEATLGRSKRPHSDSIASESELQMTPTAQGAAGAVDPSQIQLGQTALKDAAVAAAALEEEEEDEEEDDEVMKTPIKFVAKDLSTVTVAEQRQFGEVGGSVLPALIESGGGVVVATALLLLFALTQANMVVADWFLSYWCRQSFDEQHKSFYTWLYAVLVGGCVIWASMRTRMFFSFVLTAASQLHHRMFVGVLYAPMRFFESQPSGRILNRFAKDQSIVDELFPMTFLDFTQCLFLTLGYVIMILAVNPWPILVIVPTIPIFLHVRGLFITACREVKRLDALTRSPIYALFSATLSGLLTIRAFDKRSELTNAFLKTVTANNRVYLSFVYLNRWFGYRLDCISASIVLATSFSAVILRQISLNSGTSNDAGYGRSLTPSLVGLSLSYSLQLCALFQWCIRQSAEVENQLTCVERIHEYGLIPAEGRRKNVAPEHAPPPADWPAQGEIVFENVQMRYRENLPLVLNGLDVAVAPQDKIGICGRTGAGKSSLLSLLFRLVEPCGGRVLIDGVDTQTLGLLDLRSKLSIIPQEPVIFSGTLRYNLDPFDQYSDEAVWEALRAVQLAEMVQAHPAGLAMPMAEYGSNLSAGECQLVCVARALLKPVKILLVDEATANVDRETDRLVQRLLRTRFADRTVLTVAHRMLTILDSTRILALEKGRAAQYDSPLELCRPLQQLAQSVGQAQGQLETVLVRASSSTVASEEAKADDQSVAQQAPAVAAAAAPVMEGLVAQLAHESGITWEDVVTLNAAVGSSQRMSVASMLYRE